MDSNLKSPVLAGRNLIIYSLIVGILIGFLPIIRAESEKAEVDLGMTLVSEDLNNLATIEENSLLPVSDPTNPKPQPVQKIRVVITGYSSSPWETDETPYITAAGTWVREGIIANNYFPIGTKIRIPELFGDKIFVVEDRMSWTKGNYHFDIWFPDYWQALDFGAKRTYIEVLDG